MKSTSIFYDLGLWLLLVFNAYAVYCYYVNPASINTIYLIFWLQSVFIGIFNVIGMLTFTNRVTNSFTVNDLPGNRPGCAAGFFTVHYGIFHLVYLVFIFVKLVKVPQLDWQFLKLSFFAIFAGSIMQYVADKKRNRTEAVNIGTMFFVPYARIIPMHITILIPMFFSISAPSIFLGLKTVADLIMHIVYRNYLFKPSSNQAV